MALIDYERAWLALKVVLCAKPSHGQRDLLAAMARIEVESALPESESGFDGSPPHPRPVGLTATDDPRADVRHVA